MEKPKRKYMKYKLMAFISAYAPAGVYAFVKYPQFVETEGGRLSAGLGIIMPAMVFGIGAVRDMGIMKKRYVKTAIIALSLVMIGKFIQDLAMVFVILSTSFVGSDEVFGRIANKKELEYKNDIDYINLTKRSERYGKVMIDEL